jgi:adenosylcobinamide-GDP ribazoletransferase
MPNIQNITGGFITAVRTLTILRVPGKEAERPADAFYFFPLVGVLLGGLVLLVAWLVGVKLGWLAGAAVSGVAVLVGLTRALHLDGLSDVADAYFGAYDREKRLQIMKDPHIGAFGAAAVVLVLMIKVVSLERLISGGHWLWIPVPVILSRAVMVLAAVSLPYARAEGGTAEAFVKGARPSHLLAAGLTSILLCFFLACWKGVIVFAVTSLYGLVMIWWLKKTFNGVTGDLLGFVCEKTECALFMIMALAAGIL